MISSFWTYNWHIDFFLWISFTFRFYLLDNGKFRYCKLLFFVVGVGMNEWTGWRDVNDTFKMLMWCTSFHLSCSSQMLLFFVLSLSLSGKLSHRWPSTSFSFLFLFPDTHNSVCRQLKLYVHHLHWIKYYHPSISWQQKNVHKYCPFSTPTRTCSKQAVQRYFPKLVQCTFVIKIYVYFIFHNNFLLLNIILIRTDLYWEIK